jgi:ribulose-phosphate 3-epimerase
MTAQVRVIPAVLTDNPASLKKMLQQAETFTDYVQVDIMDGRFVPSHSITWKDVAASPTRLQWEVHLMVEAPAKQLVNYQRAGARKAVFHFEAATNPGNVINAARELELEVGLAVNPETPVTKILPFMEIVDGVLFLSVHPGFYGAQFIPPVLDKIVELRRSCPTMKLGIDGGIKESNIALIAASGVNEIFVGSAIFLAPDPAQAYQKLQAKANGSAG